jgi:hypothetical protein
MVTLKAFKEGELVMEKYFPNESIKYLSHFKRVATKYYGKELLFVRSCKKLNDKGIFQTTSEVIQP